MLRYLIKRVLTVIPVLLGVSILVFGFVRMIPGDPATIMLGERATPENIARVREQLGLNKPVYEQYAIFLGNALRESWEEIHLSPFNVEFLGPLPTYRLRVRRQIIFPVVGRVKRDWKYRLNWEVEKMVRIPLKEFYNPENYALYSLEVTPEMSAQGIPDPWEFPCLVHREDGEEEILWGATFAIIQSFLRLAFDIPLPYPDGRRVIHRPLISNYLTGK